MTTTLSLLKSKDEFQTLRLKAIPIPVAVKHPDHDWLCTEFHKWSQQFADYSSRMADTIIKGFTIIYDVNISRERLLNYVKALDFMLILDTYLESIRDKRSESEMRQLIAKLLTALETNSCDFGFTLGKRMLAGMNAITDELTVDQNKCMKDEMTNILTAHMTIHCDYWLKNRFIPWDQYHALRIPESFWKYLLFSIEYKIGYQMPDTVRRNPLVKKFIERAEQFGLALDDYYTLMPKIIANDITNECISYAFSNRCTIQVAIDRHYQRIMDLMAECQTLMDTIGADRQLATDQLREYMTNAIKVGYIGCYYVYDAHKYVIADDMTIKSEYWDKLYERHNTDQSFVFTNYLNIDKIM